MASVNRLKSEINLLKELFPPTHHLFRVMSGDEHYIQCCFVVANPSGKTYNISGHISTTYPEEPPVWFSDSDEISALLILLHADINGRNDYRILRQVSLLLENICANMGMPNPKEDLDNLATLNREPDKYQVVKGKLVKLDPASPQLKSSTLATFGEEVIQPRSSTTSGGALAKLGPASPPLKPGILTTSGGEVIKPKSPTTSGGPSVKPSSSTSTSSGASALVKSNSKGFCTANTRLMKELCEVRTCESHVNKVFTVELVNDDLYEWNIYLYSVDADSPLAADLASFKKKKHGKDHILFNVTFSENYPFEPPFVRVVYPCIIAGYVQNGALCMELLTKQGWSSVYTMEGVILQISATLVSGKARIDFNNKREYTKEDAQGAFKWILSVHKEWNKK